MSVRNLVIAVVGAHVGVLVLAVLFGGCAKEKKAVRLTAAAPVQEVRAPEAAPESILEPKGMVEEADLLTLREPQAIPTGEQTTLPSAREAAPVPEGEKKAAVVERKEAIIAGAAAQREEAITAAAEKKEKRLEVAAEGKEGGLAAAGEQTVKGPIVPQFKRRVAAAPAAAGVQKGAGGTHKVAAGESLWKLSQRYGVSVADLAKANNLKPGSSVRIGQVLVIPGPGAAPEQRAPEKAAEQKVAEKAPAEKARVPGVFKRHVVQKGETLSSIAKQYKVSLKKLIEVNKIENPGKVRAGQSLVVPQ